MLIRAYRNLFLFIFIFAGVFLINGGPSFGAVSDFDHLRTESTKIKTLQAEFVQKKFMKILSKPLISEGCFFYVAPDSFRWEYYKPLKSIAIAHKNKTKRYIYSRGKRYVHKPRSFSFSLLLHIDLHFQVPSPGHEAFSGYPAGVTD